MLKIRWFRIMALPLALVAIMPMAACSGPSTFAGKDDPASTSSAAALPGLRMGATCSSETPSWTQLAERVGPSVVAVEVRSGGRPAGEGSGVVIDEHHIVTNAHVIGSATAADVTVTLTDNTVLDVVIAGRDPMTDLAVLTVQGRDLTPVPIASSQRVRTGQPVMAVGNPLGLSGTVTTGIVSALHRPVTALARGGGPTVRTVTNAIQTSAPINPGNSGGALIDACGSLIGINSSIATLGDGTGSIGIGFAIPSDEMTMIAQQLINQGHARHSQLGISVIDAIAHLGDARVRAAGVADVAAGSSAQKAGIRPGDQIIAVDGIFTASALSLVGHLRGLPIGKEVSLEIARNGNRETLKATLTGD